MSPESTESQSYPPHPEQFLMTDELLHAVQAVPKGDILTYGATPLDLLITLKQQENARLELQKLTLNIIEGVPISIASFLHDSFERRFVGRAEANDENFSTALYSDVIPYLDLEVQEMVERGKRGEASPAELIFIRNQLGIRSVELACLTHPYGEHIATLEDMRDAVKQSAELFGVEWNDEPVTRYSAKEYINDEFRLTRSPLGILMTRKRDLGTLPDGTKIRERSSFILRTDEDSLFYQLFDGDGIDAMLEALQSEGDDEQAVLAPFEAFIAEHLGNDTFDQLLPISTTIYAYNAETEEQVRAKYSDREYELRQAQIKGRAAIDINEEMLDRQATIDRIVEIQAVQSAAAHTSADNQHIKNLFETPEAVERHPFFTSILSRLFKRP